MVGHTCVTHNQHCYHSSYTIERGQGSLWNWVKETGDMTRDQEPEQEREEERGEESREQSQEEKENEREKKRGRKGRKRMEKMVDINKSGREEK